MRYFLLTDESDDRPWEILRFKKNVDKDLIQKVIWDATARFWELEENGSVSDCCQGEYVLNQLAELYDFTTLPWSNDNVIYF
jgi:hypothetical protein